MSASNQTILPMSTTRFLSTLGANTHMSYTDGDYANVAQVIADLKYLGINQVRDGITNGLDANGNPNGSALISTYLAMAKAGIKFTFIIEATSAAVIQTQLALINQVETAVPGSVIAIEGPNEINNEPITFGGLTGQQAAIAAQQALYQAVKADSTLAGVPVDYFTGYASGSTDPNTVSGLADFDNQHPYPQYDQAPAFWVSRAQALTNLTGADVATAPAVYTETGYSTNQVPADVQENYTLDLVMDTAKDGISQTYLYDLLDAYAPGSIQGDDGFGLFDYTGAAKPVATAIHNLTALLQDNGANAATFKPASLNYTISGLPPTGNSMVLEKSDGTYVLVVWVEPELFNNATNSEVAAPTENVTVSFPQLFGSIQVFDPTLGASALATAANAGSITIALTDHPILIQLGDSMPASTASPVLTINAPAQVANTTEVVLSGTVTDPTATTVQVKDGSTVLGTATVSNGAWTYTSANLAAGSHNFSAVATDLAGNTSTASDAAFNITTPALKIIYNAGIDTSTTTRTVSSTTPVTISSSGSATITLAIAEDAYLGDAQFTVSVDGVQIGGVQTATALHSAGLSQNFTLQGNFGAGTHTVSVDFLNDAAAIYSNNTLAGDRNLYVTSITANGVTTVENVEQNLAGTRNYTINVPATSAPTGTAPVVTLAAAPSASATGPATLGTAVAGNSGDALTVKLLSDADFATGSSLALSNGSLIYTPGTITAANAGTDTISYTVTDSTNGLTTTETQKVTLVATAVKPTIALTSQLLAQDTGSSATDDITSNGAVTLTGTVTGATGTVVTIVDGSTVLGTATISNGNWTYSTTLSAGTHSLHAVATDPSGNTVATAAEPSITVDTTPPVVTINTPVQVANTTEVALSGTVTDALQTTVQILNGTTVLGTATVSNGSWSYTTANLAAGSQGFSAVATDLAGNTAIADDSPLTVTTPVTTTTTTPDEVLATVSTGTATTQQEVNLSSATPLTGTYVPVSTSGIGTNPLVLYNWNPATQLQGFLAAQTAGTASIVGIGDSWTDGFGSAATGWEQLSYLNEMTQALKQDGVAAQSDNFLGSEFYISNGLVDDNRLTPVGYPTTSTYYDGGFSIVAGGNAIYLNGAGKGFNFQLDTPGNYNKITLSYIDQGSGSVSLTVNGVTVGSMTFGNTGQTLTQTIKIPAGSYSDLVVQSTSANPVYIQGASFSSTTNPAIQVYDGGIGGWDSSGADTSVYQGQALKGSSNGYGQTTSAAALKPSLALVDLGINDIAGGEDTTAQSLANIEQIVATLQRAGTDVIIVIPTPFGGSAYATGLPALRAGLEAYATANNIPVIDLSATYDNSYADLEAAGLMSDLDHGDATLYADVGSQLAALLTQIITNAKSGTGTTGSGGQSYTLGSGATTITGAAGNDTITATTGTLIAADKISGGSGTNTLVLSGGGTFDLRAPAQLTNIQVVSAAEGQAAVGGGTGGVQTVYLRNGLNVTVNVASGTAASVNTNPETILIYGEADSSTINLGTGKDVVYLGSATETVNAAKTGSSEILGSAAVAGALINGNGQSTTSLVITGKGGTVVLNTADTDLTVRIAGSENLTLSSMQFITANAEVGDSTVTALASNQTLLGGVGDTLIGATAFGDLFKGTAALLNQDIIQNFGGSDQIDVTNILASKVTGLSWTAGNGGGVLSLTDGTHSASLNLTGNYTSGSFSFKADGGSGTLIIT